MIRGIAIEVPERFKGCGHVERFKGCGHVEEEPVFLRHGNAVVRRLRTERPTPNIDACRFAAEVPHDARCHHEITLGGITYRCARFGRYGLHDGIHDARLKHSDNGLVRW